MKTTTLALALLLSAAACADVTHSQPTDELPCAAEAEYLAHAIVIYGSGLEFAEDDDLIIDAATDHIGEAGGAFLDCRGY